MAAAAMVCLPGQGWRRAALGRRWLAVLAVVWLSGLLAVSVSLSGRGHEWLSSPVRGFEFELRPGPRRPLGSHHEIASPSSGKRFPAAFQQLNRPVTMALEFRLQSSGRLQQVRVTKSSGSPDLDRAVAAAVGRWRFGPLPPEHGSPAPETVELQVMNRYQLLRQGELAALLACVFVGLWALTAWRLPLRPSQEWGGATSEAERAARRMLAAAGCLAALGWLMVWRLSPDIGRGRADLPIKQACFLLASVPVVWATAAVARRWQGFGRAVARLGWFWVAAGVVLLLVTRFTPLGTDLGTGHRLWLRTPMGVVQTVELVKLLLVFFVAAAAYPAALGGLVPASSRDRQRRVVRMRPWMERYQGMLGAFALVLATLALMKDFGPLLLLAFVLLCSLVAQGHYRQSAFGAAVLLALLGVSYLVGVPSRWRERVEIWRNPWHEAAGDSRQLREGREHMTRVAWAVSAGGFAGTGLGQGMPTDIAEVQSDFMFAAVAEELGWVGGAAALALLLALVASGLSLAAQREDAFEKALLSGVAMLLGVQSALTIGGNLGLWPLTGITLPFVSYGGSSLLVNFLAVGLCVGIAGRTAELRASSLPLPADLSQRMNRSLGKLQIGFAVLFALLATKAAWLQWPANASQIAARPHLYADGSGLGNPRLDGPTWVRRGEFLDRDGRPIADPQQYVHLVGFETQHRQRVGMRNYLDGVLSGRLKGAGGLFPWRRREERGYDVVLALDQGLQAKAYQLLKEKLAGKGGRGCIVGIVPQTGEVVIAANWPPLRAGATANEWLACYDSKPGAAPFCYRKVYAPGSTFKTLVAAAALETGTIGPSDTIHCEGSYTIHKDVRPIRDWQLGGDPGWQGHGDLTLREALPPSCNCIFAKVGVKLGWKRLLRFAGGAWFNAPLPLLPEAWRGGREWVESASSAVVANRELVSELSQAEQDPVWLAQTALGQRDVRMTPLHMALWTATIANRGEMMSPTVVRAVQTSQGKRLWEFEPRQLSRVMSEETAAQLAAMMEEVVESGTGHPAWTPGVRIAGKTGTPETGLGGKDAVFIAFGPVGEPKLAVAVVLEDTQGGGGASAGPIVKALMRAAVEGG